MVAPPEAAVVCLVPSSKMIPLAETLPLTPRPPATFKAPVVFDVDAVVLVIFAVTVVNKPGAEKALLANTKSFTVVPVVPV